MLKIENTDNQVKISGTSIYHNPRQIDGLISELNNAKKLLIEQIEKQGLEDNFHEIFET